MRLAPDLIKLDRSLVAGVHERRRPARRSIASFVGFARDSDATVCAEGHRDTRRPRAARRSRRHLRAGLRRSRGRRPNGPPGAPDAARACADSFALSLAGDGDSTGDVREHASSDREELSAARSYAAVAASGLRSRPNSAPIRSRSFAGRAAWRSSIGCNPARPRRPVDSAAGMRATSTECQIVQILVGDPMADASEAPPSWPTGWRSMLRLPLCGRIGRRHPRGVLRRDRPWSRFEIRRARMLAHQIGAALDAIERRDAQDATGEQLDGALHIEGLGRAAQLPV